jgi:hypothetical protein
MEPFIHPGIPAHVMNTAEKSVERQIVQLRGWSTRLHLSLDLHAPTLLLPQKSASPNLIILNMGEFAITELSHDRSGQALRSLGGSGFQDFYTISIWRWQGCQLYALATFTPREDPWYSFLLEAELLQSQRDTAYAGQCIMGFKYF